MTAPVLDPRVHRTAFKALLTGPLNGHVYDYGKVPGLDNNPGTVPGRYILPTVSRAYRESLQSTRHASRSSWRVSVRHVGLTTNEADWAGFLVSGLLDSAVIEIGGFRSTPLQHDVTDDVMADGGMFSGLIAWTYTL